MEDIPYGVSPRALAILLFEEDREFVEWMEEREEGRRILEYARRLASEIEREHGERAPVILARERHGIAGSIAEGVQVRREYRRPLWGERLWEYTTSFRSGLPILILVMGAVFAALFWGGGELASLFSRFWESLVSTPLGRLLDSTLGANLLSRTIQWAVDGLGAVLETPCPTSWSSTSSWR
jgi:Fe2+ transport system protein B